MLPAPSGVSISPSRLLSHWEGVLVTWRSANGIQFRPSTLHSVIARRSGCPWGVSLCVVNRYAQPNFRPVGASNRNAATTGLDPSTGAIDCQPSTNVPVVAFFASTHWAFRSAPLRKSTTRVHGTVCWPCLSQQRSSIGFSPSASRGRLIAATMKNPSKRNFRTFAPSPSVRRMRHS